MYVLPPSTAALAGGDHQPMPKDHRPQV